MFLKLFNYFVDNWIPRTYYKTGNIYWESQQEAMSMIASFSLKVKLKLVETVAIGLRL
jgi:hypothetical protein